ncbi:MAG: hypothetical protein LIP01_00125 [Tannerellaceae bacterium]|nr:hypothetical protein [Tannerellaceae bacterium]
MKYNIYLICFLFSSLTLQAQKILSHNIWDGFEDEPERKVKFINWVKEQDPDIMAYQELCGFTEKDLAEMAVQYGHPYVVIAKEEGYPVGLSSKEPIELIYKQIEGY